MTSEKLSEAIRSQPFRRFRVHLGGGRSLEVRHPDFIMLSPSGRTAAVYGPRDELEVIDVFMVQSIEFLTGKNGTRRPKLR